jgi:hypothetical protein
MEEKIEFFVRCQDLLIRHHPESEFIITKENWNEKKDFAIDFVNRYKGWVYSDATICALFNKVRVEDEKNPTKTLKRYYFQESAPDFNAYCIDFVVFRKLIDCIAFCKSQYSPEIKYVLFVKNNEVKLYHTDKLLTHLSAPLSHFVLGGS